MVAGRTIRILCLPLSFTSVSIPYSASTKLRIDSSGFSLFALANSSFISCRIALICLLCSGVLSLSGIATKSPNPFFSMIAVINLRFLKPSDNSWYSCADRPNCCAVLRSLSIFFFFFNNAFNSSVAFSISARIANDCSCSALDLSINVWIFLSYSVTFVLSVINLEYSSIIFWILS